MKQEQYIHITKYGDKFYYKDRKMTKLHRLDGRPAVQYANGSKEWYVDGERHRLDGPAFEYSNGSKAWWIDGQLHRLDGRPAVEGADGSKYWYVDGQRHRLDGPAVEHADGRKYWYVDGKCLTEVKFNALTAPTMELTLEDVAAKFGVDASKIKIKK